jgi:uncharacterized membrane protein YfcA
MLLGLSLLYSLSGLLVGLFVGFTGVGGGSLMTPLLILLFGIHPETAVGTDLLYASATKTTGTTVHGLAHSVEWGVVGLLAAGSIPATVITIYLLWALGPASPQTAAVITTLLGIALFLTAIAVIFRDRIVRNYRARVGELSGRRTLGLTIATGVILGVQVSISSVGAGALGVTVLILLYLHLPLVRVVGSEIAHAVPLTLIAGMGHWLVGNVDWGILGSLLLGSIPGIVMRSYFATRAPEPLLRNVLAVVLGVVAIRLVLPQ